MTTKEALIALLERRKGEYLSGEEIARTLYVSRAAVWKAVKALREDGYAIDAVTNKGYCLSAASDMLSKQGIEKYLEEACAPLDLLVLANASSTNALMREKANEGAPEGVVIIAGEQTNGRGRRGRSFYSPPGTGIYLSLLLRPKQVYAAQAVRITSMAAVAMCEAIEEIAGETAQIKWVNDIFMRGKKVCGILTEAAFDLENSMLEYAILGVGVNAYAPDAGFPEEIRDIAGVVFDSPKSDGKNRLAAGFLNRFMAYYAALAKADYVEKYRSRSMAIGKRVKVLLNGESRDALALDVDSECRLLVRYDDGTEALLSSGEISIRLS